MKDPKLKRAVSVRVALAALAVMFFVAMYAVSQLSQYPIANSIADKLIQKYQTSSCVDLKAQKSEPPSGQQAEMMAKVVAQLKANPQMREAFINKIAPPIANKMFDCGMIP